jgi:hypothetical protein
MLGLRVEASGRAPVVMALDQDHWGVTAEAAWRKYLPRERARTVLRATGVDDRDDLLTWFAIGNARPGAWLDVTVVDTPVADVPRRKPRRKRNWRALLRARVKDQLRDIAELAAQLRALRAGKQRPQHVPSGQTSSVGFGVTVNGRSLGRLGIGELGSLSVAVSAGRGPGGEYAFTNVHGGDRIGRDRHWRRWGWQRLDLRVGDRVRIAVVAPLELDVGEIYKYEPWPPAIADQVRWHLNDLRRSVTPRGQRARLARMLAFDRERPPPRRYGRGGAQTSSK